MAGANLLPLSFGVQTNKGRYGPDGTNELINAYVENAGEEGKSVTPIYCVDGLRPFALLEGGPCRAMLGASGGLFPVMGSNVYSINAAASETFIGSVPPTGPAFMARNRREIDPQIAISSGGFVYLIVNGVLTRVTDLDLPTVSSVDFMDGYFIYTINDGSSGRYMISAIEDGSLVSALDSGSAESSPDRLLRSIRRRDELWHMGEETIEVHKNTGNATFPFERLSGATIDFGLRAVSSAVLVDGNLVWLANDNTVRKSEDYSAVRISHHDVERSIEADPNKGDIAAFTYSKGGHTYYQISGTGFTWRHDFATGTWVNLRSYGKSRHRASVSAKLGDVTVVGDYQTSNLYTVDSSYGKDGVDPLVWTIRSPIIHDFPNATQWKGLFFDVLPALGIESAIAGEVTPHATLRWSDDGGRTWSNEMRGSLGAQGEYGTQLQFYDLGQCGGQGRTWELSVSAGVSRCLMGVKANVRKLSR
jgi:hypothetical protein